MDKPEQWAVDLLEAVHDASGIGTACGMVDCPQCAKAALTIQRASEERERALREFIRHDQTCALGMRIGNDCCCGLEQALKDKP